MRTKNTAKLEPDVREIWLRRDSGILEVKIWFIYSFKFDGCSAKKITKFAEAENNRYKVKKDLSILDKQILSQSYNNLKTQSIHLPPRLISINEEDLNNLPTELFYNYDEGYTLGDSIGGISPNKPRVHNGHIREELEYAQKILFNPGVLARLIIKSDNRSYYYFQLAQKNLKNKGDVFYKPIGGHLKFKPENFIDLVERYQLEIIKRNENQDSLDVSMYLQSNNTGKFLDFFYNDILTNKSFKYFEDPRVSIIRELEEEIGHIDSSDGINLLDAKDLKFEYES